MADNLTPRERVARAEKSLWTNVFGELVARGECDCGASTTGKWAGVHSKHCASYLDDLESRVHAIAVKHCIALPEPVVREMVAYLLEGIRR